MKLRQALLPALVGGAVGCASYHPAPLETGVAPGRYNARSIGDSGFTAYREAAGLRATAPVWNPEDLALAALYFRAPLDELRARVNAAVAAEQSAGARPRPGLAALGERNLEQSGEGSPWGVQLAGTFVLETGGKRGARIAIAASRALEAEAELRASAQALAAEARLDALGVVGAADRTYADRHEEQLLDSVLPRITSRFEEGTISQGTLLQFRQQQQAAHLARVQSESDLRTANAAAAGIAGIPVSQLPELRRVEPIMTSCGPLAVLSRDSLQFLALASRWSVAAALAGYQVAEGELRLEIARQRPDLELGPGLFFDHGITRFLANFALPFLPGGNRGPIAEMEARRSTAAAHVASVQESVLLELDGGLAQCGLIYAESRSADSVDFTARARWDRTRDAYDRGEVGELEVRFEMIAALRTHRLVVLSNQHAAEGRSRLEAAVGAWSSDPAAAWPDVLGQPARRPKEPQ